MKDLAQMIRDVLDNKVHPKL